MKIVVCLHGTAPDAGPGQRDADALALALPLAGEHEVIALLAGTTAEATPLRVAVASGAARAVRIIGEDFATTDFHALGQTLASAIRRLEADVVLAGAHSSDEGLGAVSAFLARHAGLTHVARVETLEIPADGPAPAVVVTVRAGGSRRTLRVTVPAVMSVASAPAALRARVVKAPLDAPVDAGKIEALSLADPEATVVRRRTDLLGTPERPERGVVKAETAADLLAALTRPEK